MNRRAFLITCGPAAVTSCRLDKRPRLNVYNWSTYVAPNTISDFESEFGARVRYGVYESNEEMMAKVMSGNSGWDVVFPTQNRISPMRDLGLLAPLRHAWLRNLQNLDAPFQAPPWDRKLEWSVPYMWGTTGFAGNRKLTPMPRAWADLWNERLKGRLTMMDDPEEVFGACLKKLGFSYSASEPGQLRLAQREAIAQKHLVRAYINGEVRDQLVAGDVLVAQLVATTGQQAIDASPDLQFIYPAEGFGIYTDNAAILRESRHVELAHKFIDYLLRPQVVADIVIAVKTATANAAAKALLPESLRRNTTLFPAPEVFERGEWSQALPPDSQKLRDRLWTEIKSV